MLPQGLPSLWSGLLPYFLEMLEMGVPLSYLYAYHWFWNVVKGA